MQPHLPDQNKPFLGRSLGQKMALFMIPLLVFFLILMGTATYIRSSTLIENSTYSEMGVIANSMADRTISWADNRDFWLRQVDNDFLKGNVNDYLNSPNALDRLILVEQLDGIRSSETENYFSEISILRLDGEAPSIIITTAPEWETAPPPIFTMLPQDTATGQLLFDVPVIAPGSLVYISSLPLSINDNDQADILIVGVCTNEAALSLLSELQQSFQNILPEPLRSSSLYLAFKPSVLIPISTPAGSPTTLKDSLHPALSSPQDSPTFQTEYTDNTGTILNSSIWFTDLNSGIILDSPRSDALATLISFRPFLIVLIFIGALLSTFVVILTTNRLLRPLGGLVNYANRISQGDWDEHMVVSTTDEFGVLARTFNKMVERLSALYQSLEAKVEDRTRQIRIASEIARTATSSPSLEHLLERAVNLIAERFGYNNVSIYLLNPDGSRAILKESSADIGKALIRQEFSIEVNADSIIGWTASTAQLYLAEDIRNDPLHLIENLLPNTQSEAALPLLFGERALGVLDIQSSETGTLQHEDLEILTTLADQLSAAIHNASLAQTSATIASRARLITEITSRLSGVLEMDQVLEITADALHSTLGKSEVLVKLNPMVMEVSDLESLDAFHPAAETLQTPISDIEREENS
ncbi:MAG: GAF domain-containing protein [Anaerolineales bacterium]|nr:GAF domain-containing protein [Anaerolineales bacterium]